VTKSLDIRGRLMVRDQLLVEYESVSTFVPMTIVHKIVLQGPFLRKMFAAIRRLLRVSIVGAMGRQKLLSNF